MTPHCLTKLAGRVLSHAILTNARSEDGKQLSVSRHKFAVMILLQRPKGPTCYAFLAGGPLNMTAAENSALCRKAVSCFWSCMCLLNYLRWYEKC
jgi:hypothetical protein